MPNILHTVHSFGGYFNGPVSTMTTTTTLQKRDLDGAGIAVILILATVGGILLILFFTAWVRRKHLKQYARNRTTRWSVHRGGLKNSVHTMRPTARANQDLEAGYEMPQRPATAAKSNVSRNHSNRTERYKPSQSLKQYIQESAQAAQGSRSEGRSRGAPSAAEYFSQHGGSQMGRTEGGRSQVGESKAGGSRRDRSKVAGSQRSGSHKGVSNGLGIQMPGAAV